MITFSFDPIFLRLGSFQLGWHGVFTAIAVGAAVWLGLRLARKAGVNSPELGELALWAVIGGIVGARLFHVFDHLSYFAQHPLQVFQVWEGGIAVYGAFIGGIAGGLVVALRNHLPVRVPLDAATPAMLLGQMIGRLGCLSNGDAWGRPTGGSWGIVYTNANDLLPSSLLGVPTHPYPLYEIVAVGFLLGALWLVRGRLQTPGLFFAAGAIGYAAIRFGLTYFRQETTLFWGLQEAQVIALITGLAAMAFLVLNATRHAATKPAVARSGARRRTSSKVR